MSPGAFFHILIHHRLLAALRVDRSGLASQAQKTLERLQLGYWGQGTRVKALKGVARPVYEARVTRAARLLFTVARAPGVVPPYSREDYLLVWDLLCHDEVSRRGRRLNVEPEAGFLDFDSVAECALDGVPACPAAALPQGVGSADALRSCLGRQADAGGDEELQRAVRWFALDPDLVTDEMEWQDLLDDPELEELELKLSREQAETVFAPGPALLRGTAGSGKTTVGVYRLARLAHEAPGARMLYVTYSEALLNSARRIFRDLHRVRRQTMPRQPPEFLTFPALYVSCLKSSGPRPQPVRYPAFAHWYERIYGRQDAALAWEEIRGIIKGACQDRERSWLSFAEYEELGRKRAPLFIRERPRLYRVFRSYRHWCDSGGRVDDIDLARAAWRRLAADPASPRYDAVVCDEGQDLTEMEMAVLLDLCRSPGALFFAADPQQVVNPSGFRWAELRSLLRRRWRGGVPEIHSLTRNYRSVQSVVSLANGLIRLQRERTGRSDDDDFQETRLEGPAPVVVGGAREEVLGFLRGFGPRCAVITPDAATAALLKRSLDSERVFSVVDAKGLEFEGCVVWGMLDADREMWRRLLLTDEPLKEDPAARRAVHHLYVGVTRTRRYLGFYEPSATGLELWRSSWLRPYVEADAPEALSRFMVSAASPDEWREQGDYFLARERFKQAAECFRRAGDDDRGTLATAAFNESIDAYADAALGYRAIGRPGDAARCLVKAGKTGGAARLYREVGEWSDAALNFEAAGLLRDAAEAYERAGDQAAGRRCRLAHLHREGRWEAAGKLRLRDGDVEGAIEDFTRAGRRDRVRDLRLRLAENRQDDDAAAPLLERAGRWEDAADAYSRAGNAVAAARCRAEGAVRRSDWEQAFQHWGQAGEIDRARQYRACHAEELGHWLEAARDYLALRRHADVRRCLRHSDAEAAGLWQEAMQAEDQDRLLEAAELWENAGVEDRALETARVAANLSARVLSRRLSRTADSLTPADYRKRADEVVTRCGLRRACRHHGPAVALEQAPGNMAACSEETARLVAELAGQAGDWRLAAAAYEAIPDLQAAAQAYSSAGEEKKAAVARADHAVATEDFAAASAWYAQAGHRRNVHKYRGKALEQEGRFAAAAEAYEQARMTAQARRCRGLAVEGQEPVTG